jgi:REP element-mobilizing transposase RayT
MSEGIFNQFTGYHNRQSIRLKKYDYSQPGYYFITICVHDREQNLFGEIVESMCMNPNIAGGCIVGAGSKPAQLSGSDYNAADFKHRAGLEPAPARTMGTAPTTGNASTKTTQMHLNPYGNIVQSTWYDLTNHITGISLDAFIIMPNHIHGIIRINDFNHQFRAGLEPAPTGIASTGTTPMLNSLPEIIRQFKTFSAKRINIVRNSPGIPIWQRNYYDHIIRNERSLYFIRKYIYENPLKWSIDSEKHLSIEEKETEKHFTDAPVTK